MGAKQQGCVESVCHLRECQLLEWFIVRRFESRALFEGCLFESVGLLHGGHLHCGSLKECKDVVLAQTRVTLVDVCVLVYQINEAVDSCTDYRRWRLVCVDW